MHKYNYVVTILVHRKFYFVDVSNLRFSRRTTHTITIVWDPADSPNCGPVLYYTVTTVNSVNPSDVITTESNENIAHISNLKNNATYTINVAAVNRVGSGPTSTIIVAPPTNNGAGKLMYLCNACV